MTNDPVIVMLAGPNGAGKSTFREAYLSHLDLPFLNADVLAEDTGLDAYEAAASIAQIRDAMISRKESFITETVLSDPVGEKIRILENAAQSGYEACLIYIGIANPDLSRRRVRARVEAGGHDVPTDKLTPRYERSLDNLERAIAQLPRVLIYDNSFFEKPYRFLAEFSNGKLIRSGKENVPQWARRFLR